MNPANIPGLSWRKSSHSGAEGGQCVEVADLAAWRKSSHSDGSGGECVEVAEFGPAIGIRDSKNPAAPALLLTRTTFATLLTQAKSGL